MRNFNLGVGRRDLLLFGGTALVAFVLTVVWHFVLIDVINGMFKDNAQPANKYFLTFVLYALAIIVTLVSLALGMRGTGRPGVRAILPGCLIRFGLALQVFGILITPIGLVYAADPQRSVPVGFASFTTVFVGLFLAGIGGNMIAPRRA